jgi:hypothetical protein
MRRPPKPPIVRTWSEAIDDATVVGCALVRDVRTRRQWEGDQLVTRRMLYALGCFVLIEARSGRWRARKVAEDRLLATLGERWRGRLLLVGPAEDVED